MKPNLKLIRVAVAAFVGSVLWAGCSGPNFMVADSDTISAAPVDMTKRRPETHPELRSGLWQTVSPSAIHPRVVASTVVRYHELDAPPVTTADTTSLFVYNPEVVNIALGATSVPAVATTSDGVIVEAAGTERGAIREPRSWGQRVVENRRRLEQIEAD